jgi:hypothetical protein
MEESVCIQKPVQDVIDHPLAAVSKVNGTAQFATKISQHFVPAMLVKHILHHYKKTTQLPNNLNPTVIPLSIHTYKIKNASGNRCAEAFSIYYPFSTY